MRVTYRQLMKAFKNIDRTSRGSDEDYARVTQEEWESLRNKSLHTLEAEVKALKERLGRIDEWLKRFPC